MSFSLYQYKAKVVRVIDGDTAELDIDLGATVRIVVICRLFGLNAPEVHGATADAGKASTEWLRARLYDGVVQDIVPVLQPRQLWVRSNMREKFGRLLVTIWDHEPGSGEEWATSINQELIDAGMAVPMPK